MTTYHAATTQSVEKEAAVNQDIRDGRWVQWRGRAKRAWGRLVGNEVMTAEGNADVIAGALQESIGVARKEASREVTRGVDAVADFAKKAAKALER
jgi:uncharacterized protein YjbJ (UPF0337 family)